MAQSLASECDKDEIWSTESDEDEIQSDLPLNELRHPEIGMEFSSEEDAYKFYKKYAEEVGFSVRKGKVQRLANGTIRKRNFLCSRQGFKLRKISNKNTKYERKETRTGCNAYTQFTVEDGKWVISNFILEHNHEFDKPRQKHAMNSVVNNVIEVPTSTKTTPDNVWLQQVDAVKYGLPDNTSFNTFLQAEDVQHLMNLFSDLQVRDPSFFYAIQVDAANHMTSFFWRDCASRMDYSCFGDVVVFDTTIRVDNMIYAPFWGVNHHHQRVLFGCALLLDESLESFLWLFKVFVTAMDNLQPKTLYSTDESQAISTAIEKVLPKTQHRLFVNCICKNAKKHLSAYFDLPGFENLFKKCIFDCQSKQEFESQWDSLLAQYNLRENPWLTTLYSLWEKWSHLFSKKTFSADIGLLFNSPNINVSEIMSLPDFVQQYVKEAKQRRLEELCEDSCCRKMVPVRSRKGMEKHAEDIYTSTMFKKFQDELLDSLSLAIEEVTSSGNISAFKLTEEGHKKEDIVTFDCSSSTVTCSCGKFESIGILCGHCIKVLNAKNIFEIPSQYILKRWTKTAKEVEVVDHVDHHSENDLVSRKNQRQASSYSRTVMHKALQIINKSTGIEESRKMVQSSLDFALKRADEILKENGMEQTISSTSLEVKVDGAAFCGIDGAVFNRNQKMTSNSSCVNREQRSKNKLKKSIKHGFTKTM